MNEKEINIVHQNSMDSYEMIKVLQVYCEFSEEDYVTIRMLPILECIEKNLKRITELF